MPTSLLTDQQIADYRRLGFTAIPGFFDADEVHALRVELARLIEAGEGRNVSTEGDGTTYSTTATNFQICPLSHRSPLVRALPFTPKVVEIIEAVLGCDFRLRLDQIFLKPAHTGAGTNWHQDNAYFKHGGDDLATRGVGMWIAIHDATVANGTMHVIPEAFQRTDDHRRDGGSDHHVTCADRIDESQAVPVELPAGGVLLFNYGVPHCTKANTSDQDRAGLALHFEDVELAPDCENPVISGAGADGGQSAYDEDQRGRWQQMVEESRSAALS